MDEFLEAEIWFYKKTNSKKIKNDLRIGSDLSEEMLDKIIDKFAEMHVMNLMSGYNELYSEFLSKNCKTIKDTKIARKLNKGKILTIDGGKLKVINGF